AVVVVDGASAGRVAPVPAIVIAVLGRALQLSFGNSCPVAAERGVVLQRLPGQWIVIVANAEKAAEAQNSIRHLAADLVDHDPFNRADLVVAGAIDRRTFDLVASDQGSGFTYFRSHVN